MKILFTRCVKVWSIISVFYNISLAQEERMYLNFGYFLDLVKNEHPVSRQAALIPEIAKAYLLTARGNFDPLLTGDYSRKQFEGKEYYDILGGGLKLPTRFALDLKTSYENNSGEFLNDSDILPDAGLWKLGVSVPVGRGLLMDERRAEWKKAEIFSRSSIQEQILMMNDLLYDAIMAFLSWQEKTLKLEIAEEGFQLAGLRMNFIRQSFIQGDRPAIDTLEAFIALQNREQFLIRAGQDWQIARLEVQKYLWRDGQIPMQMDSLLFPQPLPETSFQPIVDSLHLVKSQVLEKHPEILGLEFKKDQMSVDGRLWREDLKPDLRLEYFPLMEGGQGFLPSFNAGNYMWGATLYFPVLQRKARGKISLNDLEISEVDYDILYKLRTLETVLLKQREKALQESLSLELNKQIIANNLLLLEGENKRFEFGESSVFLVNSRELAYLESRLKLIENQLKLWESRLDYLYYCGQVMQVR